MSFAGTDITAGETVLPPAQRADQPRNRRAGRDRDRRSARLCGSRASRSFRPATRSSLRASRCGRPCVYDSQRPGAGRRRARAGRRADASSASSATMPSELARTSSHARVAECDVVLLSGGTSKGPAICRIAWSASCAIPASSLTASRSSPASRSAWRRPRGKPVVVLPGFPTSAIFTFHEFVAPVIRRLAGLGPRRTIVRDGASP